MRKIISMLIIIIVTLTFTTGVFAVSYTPLGVPNINSSFKTWMDYKAITNRKSPQYRLLRNWGWIDYEGFIRFNGERNLGITDDYYAIALGSYYGSKIGTKYRITLSTGKVFYGVLADQKADIHTNSTHQYAGNNDVVEFLVNTSYSSELPGGSNLLNSKVRSAGSANVYMPLNGSVTQIERIDF